jgi:hypothetical protein
LKSKDIKHGKIRLGFTPDEEIGKGTDYFDVKKFGPILPTHSMAEKLVNSSLKILMLPGQK